MKKRVLAALAVALSLAVSPFPAFAQRDGSPTTQPRPDGIAFPRIVNGLPSTDHPTAVAILHPSSASPTYEDGAVFCSGTLIGCSTILTAAHCVDGEIEGPFSVFLEHGGILPVDVDGIWVHPDYSRSDQRNDVAVLSLPSPVTGITPTPINTLDTPAPGSEGTIVGFGHSGELLVSDPGLKRIGRVEVEDGCPAGPSQICWRFAEPLGPPGLDSDTCNIDSGGPLFWNNTVAGITSFGENPFCTPPDTGVDTNVYYFRDWIADHAGEEIGGAACGNTTAVLQPGSLTDSIHGTLDLTGDQDVWHVSVPAGTASLRFGLNGTQKPSSFFVDGHLVREFPNFDLYVRHGAKPTTSMYDCSSAVESQFEYCEITDPTPGTWYALVDSALGKGEYQLVATQLQPRRPRGARRIVPRSRLYRDRLPRRVVRPR